MKASRRSFQLLVCVFALGLGVALPADWLQWAHDPQHNGYLPDVDGQSVGMIRWAVTIDNTVPDPPAEILIHYASPLVDGDGNIFMTNKQKDDAGVVHRSVMKLEPLAGGVVCSYETDYVPPASTWEPVFHPVLANGMLYVPGLGGAMHLVSPDDCSELGTIFPYDPSGGTQNVFVGGVPSTDGNGNVYYPLLVRFGGPPGLTHQFVQIDPTGATYSVSYADLTGDSLQQPPLNAGAAIGPDGTIYIGSARSGGGTGWLLALNPDLSLQWKSSMTQDPGRAALLIDQSSSCPVVGPDGRIFYGGWNTNQQSDGYLYSFAPDGTFLRSFQFGWDTTPAIFPDPDGDPTHYHLVEKYNRYLDQRYYMVSLSPDTMNIECQWELVGREWCINAPAIDRNGAVYTNGEDGFLYRLTGMYPDANGACNPQMTRIMLDQARDAAYTPLALAPDGTIYTLNNGRLFSVGDPMPRP